MTVTSTIRQMTYADRDALEQYFATHLSHTNHLLPSLTKESEFNTHTFIGAYDNQKLVACAIHEADGFITLLVNTDLKKLLRQLLTLSKRPVIGLQGFTRACNDAITLLFADAGMILGRATLDHYQLSLDQLIVPHKIHQGEVDRRELQVADFGWYLGWRRELFKTLYKSYPDADTEAALERTMRQQQSQGLIWVLEYADKAVSACTVKSSSTFAIGLGDLWTPLEYRSREFARSIAAGLLLDSWSRRIPHAFIKAPADSPAAAHCLNALGFEKTGQSRQFICKKNIQFKI